MPAERRDTGVDYDTAAVDYDRTRGRAVAIGAWQQPVGRALATLPPGPVLDLGAGSGLWSASIARWTGHPVVALEPSAGMQAQARRTGRDPRPAPSRHCPRRADRRRVRRRDAPARRGDRRR
jgi:ubiquinone/menaquinone biosynthesis C-methylase UbiE